MVAAPGALPPLDGEGGFGELCEPKSGGVMFVARARQLRKRMTRSEARLWTKLRTLRPQGYHFRRQAPFGPYILDFVCFSRKLIVEVDGDSHGTEAARLHDTRRDSTLAMAGLRTFRVTGYDVLRNIDGVMEMIVIELER